LIKKDGLSNLTFPYVMVACLSSPIRLIEARPNNKTSKLSDELIELIYLIAYQAKLIEEGS